MREIGTRIGVSVLAGALAAAAPPQAPADAPQPCQTLVSCTDPRGCPDFVTDRNRLSPVFQGGKDDPNDLFVATMTFSDSDCVVVEGMVSAGSRKLMWFNTLVGNRGPGALTLGNPVDHPEWFDLVTCHGHPHIKDYADYRLWTPSGYQEWAALRLASPGACPAEVFNASPDLASQLVSGPGKKRGFCLVDFGRMSRGTDLFNCPAGQRPDKATYKDCDNGGLGVCRYDSYPVGVDGQWVDITGLPDGEYVLEIELNATHLIDEADFDNNSGAVRVLLSGDTATIIGFP